MSKSLILTAKIYAMLDASAGTLIQQYYTDIISIYIAGCFIGCYHIIIYYQDLNCIFFEFIILIRSKINLFVYGWDVN